MKGGARVTYTYLHSVYTRARSARAAAGFRDVPGNRGGWLLTALTTWLVQVTVQASRRLLGMRVSLDAGCNADPHPLLHDVW